MAKFIINNIIGQCRVLNELISDQGSHLKKEMVSLLEKYKIQREKSSPYRPQTNGAVEAANKNIQRIIEKMVKNHKDELDKLPFPYEDIEP